MGDCVQTIHIIYYAHPTNNHAPIPSFSNSPLKMPKLRTSKRPVKTIVSSKGPELTTEPFSRLRDEPASILHRPFLGRGRVGKTTTFVEMRRPPRSITKIY